MNALIGVLKVGAMKTLIIIAAILIAFPVHAFDKWTLQDTVLELTWATLHVIDWGQTLEIADKSHKYHEHNPILGRHPSKGEVHAYMALGLLVHPIITHTLPREVVLGDYRIPVRTIWQSVSIVVTGGCVINNLSIGLNVAF